MHLAHLLIEEDSLQEVGPKKTAIKWIFRQVQEGSPSDNLFCYTSQLKCIFSIAGECITCRGSKLTNSLGQAKLTNSLGQVKLTNSTGEQQLELPTRTEVVLLENHGKFVSQPALSKGFLSNFFYL